MHLTITACPGGSFPSTESYVAVLIQFAGAAGAAGASLLAVVPTGRYIDEMSKFAFRGKSRGDGKITLAEFEEYFDHVADQDTGDAETSPLACKVLVALEYVPLSSLCRRRKVLSSCSVIPR